jgi:hypothetical protein
MDYLILKSDNRREIRIYPEGVYFEGKVIYKGHKLGVEMDLLSKVIEFRRERTSNVMLFLRYDKVTEKINSLDRNIWKVSSLDSFEKEVLSSWDLIKENLEKKVGKFRKILITIVNI